MQNPHDTFAIKFSVLKNDASVTVFEIEPPGYVYLLIALLISDTYKVLRLDFKSTQKP
jgi:hypothetical protein